MWRLDTQPALWGKRDEVRSTKMLLELVDIPLPATFSWTRAADREQALGSYGTGSMDDWLQRPPDQGCCGFCYAVATSAALSDRLAIQTFVPHAPVVGAAGPCPASTVGTPALSPLAFAACLSAASPEFHGCAGGAVDHTLGTFLEQHGVQHCTGTALSCPGGDATPALPACPAGPRVRARAESFTLLKYNTSIRAQIMQGPVPAAFRCPSTFVQFGGPPVADTGRSFGGWHKVHSGGWTHAFAWHGVSDNGAAGHAVTLVGFVKVTITDPRDASRTLEVDAWVARNSFGTAWGDEPFVGAGYKGYLLYVATSSGFNGTLGIGECQDSVGICQTALSCKTCTVDTSHRVQTAGAGDARPVVRCEECEHDVVGAVVFDADGDDQGYMCRHSDYVVVDTCAADPTGTRSVRCTKWPADRPAVEWPCGQHVYLGDSMTGAALRLHEDDTGAGGRGEVGLAAPRTRVRAHTTQWLALVVTMPIVAAALVAAIVATALLTRQ